MDSPSLSFRKSSMRLTETKVCRMWTTNVGTALSGLRSMPKRAMEVKAFEMVSSRFAMTM